MLKKIVFAVDKSLGMISAVLIAMNAFLLAGSVVSRLLGSPIAGVVDYVGLISAVTIAFAIPYVAMKKGHIRVELLESRLPPKGRNILSLILEAVTLLTVGVFSYECCLYAINCFKTNSKTWVAFIPYWPIVVCIAVGFLFYSLTSAVHMSEMLMKEGEER